MKMQVSTDCVEVAMPVLIQATVCGGDSFLQALHSVSNVTGFALTTPSILQSNFFGKIISKTLSSARRTDYTYRK